MPSQKGFSFKRHKKGDRLGRNWGLAYCYGRLLFLSWTQKPPDEEKQAQQKAPLPLQPIWVEVRSSNAPASEERRSGVVSSDDPPNSIVRSPPKRQKRSKKCILKQGVPQGMRQRMRQIFALHFGESGELTQCGNQTRKARVGQLARV